MKKNGILVFRHCEKWPPWSPRSWHLGYYNVSDCLATNPGRPHMPGSYILCPSILCPSILCPSILCPSILCPSILCPSILCQCGSQVRCTPQNVRDLIFWLHNNYEPFCEYKSGVIFPPSNVRPPVVHSRADCLERVRALITLRTDIFEYAVRVEEPRHSDLASIAPPREDRRHPCSFFETPSPNISRPGGSSWRAPVGDQRDPQPASRWPDNPVLLDGATFRTAYSVYGVECE